MVQEAINAALQVALAVLIALVLWAIFARKKESFPRFVGLIAPAPGAMLWALGAALVLVPASIALFFLPALNELATASNTVAGRFRSEGFSADIAGQIAIIALIKTALSEEIFFRGLLAKRLIKLLGFAIGNTLHAVLFGAIHLLVFVVPSGPAFDPMSAGAMFFVTGAGGWVMAWLNERVGNGSIAPSWFLHALTNLVAYPVLAFA